MPRPSMSQREKAKSHSFTCYPEEWKAIIRLIHEKRLHSPFDIVRLAFLQATEPLIVAERVKGTFRDPRFSSGRTLKHRGNKFSRAA